MADKTQKYSKIREISESKVENLDNHNKEHFKRNNSADR